MFDSKDSKYVFPPKVGAEPIVVTVKQMVRNCDVEEEKQYKHKTKGAYGYRDDFHLENGKIMPCNTWKLYFALRDAGCDNGATVKISHPANGRWEAELVLALKARRRLMKH